MPTPHVSADNMEPGKKGRGKNWTKAEIAARQAAAEGAKRPGRVILRMPDWLSEEARQIWKRVRRQTAGLELLDNLDADMLAIYCDAVANYRKARESLKPISDVAEKLALGEADDGPTMDDTIKSMQAWARLVAAFAEKLGFTPSARARLIKKKADEIADRFGDEFDG